MANRYAITGLACVGLATVGALVFVGELILGSQVAGVVGMAAAAGPAWCWYLQPLLRRRALYRQRSSPEPRPARQGTRPVARAAR